jgi:hypothetical protein
VFFTTRASVLFNIKKALNLADLTRKNVASPSITHKM